MPPQVHAYGGFAFPVRVSLSQRRRPGALAIISYGKMLAPTPALADDMKSNADYVRGRGRSQPADAAEDPKQLVDHSILATSQSMNDHDMISLVKAATERQMAVAALQKKYARSESVPTEQLVLDMRELLATERVVLDAIITLFAKLDHGSPADLTIHQPY
jgi:hypothetical protein